MKFNLSFKANIGYAVEREKSKIGIRGLQEIREELNCPGLSAELVLETINERTYDVVTEVSEDYAGRSGRFEENNSFNVPVKTGFLSSFLRRKTKTIRSESDDSIKCAFFIYETDTDEILEAWEGAGFPSPWDEE